MKVIKRNGSEMPFDKGKIWNAVAKADAAGRESGLPDSLATEDITAIADAVEKRCVHLGRAAGVEEIQDIVEEELINAGHPRLMRLYTHYRHKHEMGRRENSTDGKILALLKRQNEEVFQENSNKNPIINSTMRDYMAGEASRDLVRRYFMPEDVMAAHDEGIIHVHDTDYISGPLHNCDLINLEDMLQNGTVISGTLIDICKRNGKKKLLWLKTKEKSLSYEPKSDEMVLTVHRWFANKSCPGDWLMARMDDLASKVTAALGGAETSTDTSSVADSVSVEKKIWDYLYGMIENANGVAGLMANLFCESGLKSNNLQNSYNKKLNISDEDYTRLVDGNNYPDFVKDKAGYGLAQWTYYTRKQALLDFAKSKGKSIGDLDMQLEFLWKEINESYPAVLTVLKGAGSVREASDAVLLWYERPADQSESVMKKRTGYGEGYYKKYAGAKAQLYRVRKVWKDAESQIGAFKVLQNAKDCTDKHPGYSVFDEDGSAIYSTPYPASKWGKTPFLVRVTIKDLNIRVGAGTDTAKTGKATGEGVFTIVEVRSGKGSTNGWGSRSRWRASMSSFGTPLWSM